MNSALSPKSNGYSTVPNQSPIKQVAASKRTRRDLNYSLNDKSQNFRTVDLPSGNSRFSNNSMLLDDTGRQKNLYIKSSLKIDNYRGDPNPDVTIETESPSHNRLSPSLKSYSINYRTPLTYKNKAKFSFIKNSNYAPQVYSTLENARKGHIRYLTQKFNDEAKRRIAHEKIVTFLRDQRGSIDGFKSGIEA